MYQLSSSEITDNYIKECVEESFWYDRIDSDIEKVRIYMMSLRYDLRHIHVSKITKQEIKLRIERLMVMFNKLIVERDKKTSVLRIKIPYTPEFFVHNNTSTPD